ncbi:hypothetical protein OIU74_019870 [Salix koriyanagi]|uniref:Uncharacterized protein n=1 Tax=Salix koriyanagi TaxID=2511006 RepID=A0A9Q0P4J2_9ROSI|nr:hypothetical protein OIU74_019870 [Salix koriyanagi]
MIISLDTGLKQSDFTTLDLCSAFLWETERKEKGKWKIEPHDTIKIKPYLLPCIL